MRVFSTLQGAKDAIERYCIEMEQDVFIYETEYPCGFEYVLKLRNEISFPDSPAIKFAYFLPITWAFKIKDNAIREAEVWANRTGKIIFVEDHMDYVKGYRRITHYTLTDKMPKDV